MIGQRVRGLGSINKQVFSTLGGPRTFLLTADPFGCAQGKSLEDALHCEKAVLDALSELEGCDNFGEKQRRDIQRAKQGLRLAMVRERICKRLLLRSKRELKRALGLLEDIEQEESQVGKRRRNR
jgi:hypothetical protein